MLLRLRDISLTAMEMSINSLLPIGTTDSIE